MRLKIVAAAESYQSAHEILASRNIKVLLQNDKRFMIAVANCPEDVQGQLRALGCRVESDSQYEPQHTITT